MKVRYGILVWLIGWTLVYSERPVESYVSRTDVLNTLQRLSHGAHTEKEWISALETITQASAAAERAGDIEELIEWQLLASMVHRDMRGAPQVSLRILDGLFEKYDGLPLENFKKVYLDRAETFAVLGREQDIMALINTFKSSIYLDLQTYTAKGGDGPNDPIVLERPQAGTGASITVTAMESFLRKAQYAVGKTFPNFPLTDDSGQAISLAELGGRVVLLDFWVKDWLHWRNDLPTLKAAYERYHNQGFEIIGVNLGQSSKEAERFARKANLEWPIVFDGQAWGQRLGLYGEADNFLLDRTGKILARGLRGSN